MKRISFNQCFVNGAGDDLIPGKIHTIRQNYEYWKRFEGRDVALFSWEGYPYRSKQKVFCTKRIVSVQKVLFEKDNSHWIRSQFRVVPKVNMDLRVLAINDGFDIDASDFISWFRKYKSGEMAIIHFTDFRY